MKPNRKPDFIHKGKVRYKANQLLDIEHYVFWKEAIAIVKLDGDEYEYDIVVTEFGRIDMRLDNISESISWLPGIRESYINFLVEEALLYD